MICLFYALRANDKELVKALLQHPIVFEPQKRQGLLVIAVRQGDLELIKMLVEHGVPVDQPNPWGETALQIAALNWYPDIVDLLLRAGANVNLTDLKNRSPLLYAIMLVNPAALQKDQFKVIRMLLAAGLV